MARRPRPSSVRAAGGIVDLGALRDRAPVFRDRAHAGTVLATMMEPLRGTDALVVAIPSGGVPVAVALAEALDLPLDVAPVSKITLPWDTESGYGAVAFDGTVRFNEALLSRLGLDHGQIERGVARTRGRVARRLDRLRGRRPWPDLDRTVVLVDDGLASGFTLRVAVEAMGHLGARDVVVAVPTAEARSAAELARQVTTLYCANVRTGSPYAVADAYEHWRDVTEEEVERLLTRVTRGPLGAHR